MDAAQAATFADRLHDQMLRGCWHWRGRPPETRKGPAPHRTPKSQKANAEYADTTPPQPLKSAEVAA
jgi:hypothetical protein